MCALLTPAALAAVHGAYVALFARFPESVAVAAFVRFILPFAVLIVPTALMGATLPLVMKSSLTGIEGLGTRAGLLYAANTGGAIVGALAAGLYLIPQIGLRRSFLLAAAVNGLVGVSALIVSRMRERSRRLDDAPVVDASAPLSGSELSPALRIGILAVFAVSGFASLALEIVWFRALVILLGPSSFAFTLMLATVLLGIALGSLLVTPFMRQRFNWLQSSRPCRSAPDSSRSDRSTRSAGRRARPRGSSRSSSRPPSRTWCRRPPPALRPSFRR